ncbi:topoisomerase DNA-binding C4 zinc finger domain-containing protein [Aquabacterium sp.]
MPVCPRCGSSMVVWEAKKAPSAGNKFLGCSKFPACKGTLPL